MSKGLVLKKYSVSVLICLILIFDLAFSPIFILVLDKNTYIDYNAIFSYDELFSSSDSSGEKVNAKDFMMFHDYINADEYAKDILSSAQFESVSAYKYGIIMILYNAKKEVGDLSLVFSLSELSKKYDDDIISLAQSDGFCSSGMLFFYRNELYLLAHMKDINKNVFNKKSAINTFQTSENRRICLFKVKNAENKFISKYVNAENFTQKHYPEILKNIRISYAYKVVILILFVAQFLVVFLLKSFWLNFSKHKK